jgi:phenylalanyl-tRNA synthetase beta chain
MKLTLNWLREFVDLPDDPQVVADAFENLGFEVEELRPLEPTFSGVVIGKVLEVGPHPNADKIRLCRVDIGGEVSEIVCGAWNFEAGAIVPVAVPGAMLGGSFEIGRRPIRGIVSHGMICSEHELEIGEDAAGIMVLDADYPAAADRIGDDFASVLDLPDTFMDVEVNPNRPDCMSVLGLARELAAYFEVPLREPDYSLPEVAPASAITVTIDDPEGCPRFVGREVRNIAPGPSPHWLRMRLVAAGVRPISNVVDASNYAMIEIGHPTHAFDADRLGDTIVVRRAQEGETITTLDDVDRALLPGDIVVADASRAVAIAGVMGGADTEVHEGSTRVLIEAAYWHPPSILLTSKRLNLRSEASARFERGMDPNFCHLAADRVARLLVDHAGGEAVASRVDAYPVVIEPDEVLLPLSEVPRVLGVPVPAPEIRSHLERLGFEVAGDDPLRVAVPTRRPDVARPVDLIEEIARLHGYDNIPDRIATGPGGGLAPGEKQLRKLRRVLAGAGFHEVLLFSFIGAGDLDALDLPATDARRRGVPVVNPLRDEEGVMRTTLLPGLLKAAGVNQARRIGDVSLFEIGKVFLPGDDKLPEQPDHLGFVAVGRRDGDWSDPGRDVDLRDGTGLWELVASQMRLPWDGLRPVAAPPFHPGRAAEITVADVAVGVVGEIHPRVAARFGLSGGVVAGEMELAPLVTPRDDWVFAPPSPYPPAVFDLAFELDAAAGVGPILETIRSAAGEVLEELAVFDLFSGPPLPEGRKSVAVRLTLRAAEKTLTDKEAAAVRRDVVSAVVAATGGVLRGEL